METSKVNEENSPHSKKIVKGDEENDDEDPTKRKKKGKRGFSGDGTNNWCQVVNCTNSMTDAKKYHLRHKVCEFHAKAAFVEVSGLHQRFCQQCSSLMRPNGAVDVVWPDTMNGDVKAHQRIMEKTQTHDIKDVMLALSCQVYDV